MTEEGDVNDDSTLLLRHALDLIITLISLSYNVRAFPGKWQTIRTKLDELNSALQAAENRLTAENNTNTNIPLLNLVQAFLQTLGRCHQLATQCVHATYTGKLLMQSDLDSASANLDAHIATLSAAYAAGVLSNGSAIVVSRPGPGAPRDDIKFYVGDVVTRLKIGDSDMKRNALVTIHEMVVDSEKCARIVMENDEFVRLLPNFMDSPESQIQEESAKVVAVVCGFESYKGLLVGAGIIPPLIRVLEGGCRRGKEHAVKSLLRLTENSDNAWCVSAHGGVTALLNICCSKESEGLMGELMSTSCGVLINLVGVEEIKRFMVEEGAISSFVDLVGSGKYDESTQISSMEFLKAIAYGDESVRGTVVAKGGIDAMVSVLDPGALSSYKAREAALKAVESLCFASAKCFHLLVSCKFVDHLLWLLRNGEARMQELALKVGVSLCGVSEEAKKAMGDAGFMPEFVRFLEAKSYEIRSMAAEAVCGMVMVPKNRKRFLQEERNVGVVLQMVEDCKEGSGELKVVLSILVAVSSCSGVRRRLLGSSGCMKKLEKLAQSGVHDAKKIIRKVSSNRFQSMVNKILHFDG